MRPVIIIPLAGKGTRFPKSEWLLPKPLILIDDRSIIEWSMSCIDYTGCDLVFIVRQEHIDEYSIDSFLKQKFGENTSIVVVPEVTRGAVETCLAAKKFIRPDCPVIIHCSDVYWEPKFAAADFQCENDGCILTFKSNSPNYSYSKVSDKGYVEKVAEKKVISEHASVGIYWFKRGEDFIRAANRMKNSYSGVELHIAPIYNLLIEDGKKVSILDVEKMHIVGTPEELNFFTNNSLKTFPHRKNRIILASDHSGFMAKEIFKKILDRKNIRYVDVGCFNEKNCDYTPYVQAACRVVLKGESDFGVVFCRSGQGVNIAANKVKGIRSAWVATKWLAEQAIKHNCVNFYAISEQVNTENSMEEIIDAWLSSTFDGGRHQGRLMLSAE